MGSELSTINNGISPCFDLQTFWGCNETSQFETSKNNLIRLVSGIIAGASGSAFADILIGKIGAAVNAAVSAIAAKLGAALSFNPSVALAAIVAVLAFID